MGVSSRVMIARPFTVLFLWLSFGVVGVGQSPTPTDLHVKLSFAENKSVYRIGEPIKLVMEFSADREGYVVEFTPDRDRPTKDRVVLSPETGVTHWLDELNDNYQIPRDVMSEEPPLIEMARVEARSYVIAEIRDPNSAVDPKVLGALKDESLPEVDASLLEQIRRLARSAQPLDAVRLKLKTALLVRFATDNIYRELMHLHQELGTSLARDERAGFLAYFTKHNEREGMSLVEQAVAELKPGEHPRLLSELTALYYSDAIGALLKKLLETDDFAMASHAAYLIGVHGAAGDEKLLEARLKRWQKQWRDRVAEADAQQQGRIERELIYALINGKSWKLPLDRVRELQTSGVTQLCKRSNQVQQ